MNARIGGGPRPVLLFECLASHTKPQRRTPEMGSQDSEGRRVLRRSVKLPSKYQDPEDLSDSDDQLDSSQGCFEENGVKGIIQVNGTRGGAWASAAQLVELLRTSKSVKSTAPTARGGRSEVQRDMAQALAQHNGMLPSLDSVLSFLKHVAAGKVHPAACYKPKPRQNSAQSKRRSRNPDAEEYLPYGYNRATPARKKAKHMARHHPVSDAVALTISFRGLQWHAAVERAADHAGRAAEKEAEEAALSAAAQVYILTRDERALASLSEGEGLQNKAEPAADCAVKGTEGCEAPCAKDGALSKGGPAGPADCASLDMPPWARPASIPPDNPSVGHLQARPSAAPAFEMPPLWQACSQAVDRQAGPARQSQPPSLWLPAASCPEAPGSLRPLTGGRQVQWPQLPPPLPQRPAVPDSSPPASTQPGLPAPASRAVPGPAAGGDAQDLSSLPCADHLSHDLDADGHPASECRQREASAAAPQAQRPVQAPSASCLRHTGSPAAGLHQQQSDDAAQPSFCARAAHITAPSIAAAPHASKQSQSPAAQQAPAGAAACDHSQLQMQPTPLQQAAMLPKPLQHQAQASSPCQQQIADISLKPCQPPQPMKHQQAFRPGTKIVLQGGCSVFKNGCISQTGIPSEISLQTASRKDGTPAHWEPLQVGGNKAQASRKNVYNVMAYAGPAYEQEALVRASAGPGHVLKWRL